MIRANNAKASTSANPKHSHRKNMLPSTWVSPNGRDKRGKDSSNTDPRANNT